MKKLLIILLFPIYISAQTKLYLNIGVTCAIPVGYNAGWNVTTSGTRYMMKPVKDGSTIASTTSGQIGGSAVRKTLIAQFISEPLATQTLSGTLDGQIRFNQNSTTSTTGQGFVYLRIVEADGTTIRTEIGTLTTTSLTTTLTNRTLVQLSLAAGYSIVAGDRLVIDVGWNESVGTTTTRTGTASFGSSSATDMAIDNTTVTANNPYILFSQTLVYQKSWLSF